MDNGVAPAPPWPPLDVAPSTSAATTSPPGGVVNGNPSGSNAQLTWPGSTAAVAEEPTPAAWLGLLRVAVPTAASDPRGWLRWQVGRSQKARLLGRIEGLRAALDEAGSVPLASLPAEAPRRLYRAMQHHSEALVLFSGGFREEAWQRVQAAEREMLHVSDPDSLVNTYHRLAAEGRDKLTGWRLQAFDKALGAEPLPAVDLTSSATVAEAQTKLARRLADARLVLDEHFGNEAVRARVIGRQLRLAAFGMAVALCLYLLAVGAGWPAKLVGSDQEPSVLLTSPAAVTVLGLFGVLGAF